MQNDRKIIAETLLEIAKNAKTEFIEDAKIDKELIEAAKKIGIILPSPDLCLFKTTYAEIDKTNLNGVRLPRKAVEKGLPTLVGKNCNWEHNGSGFVAGYTIKAEINGDKIETINVIFKSLFIDQFEELKEKIKSGEASVSFEIWNISPETKKSVVKKLADGTVEISPIIFHGTGVLLVNPPACPDAKIFKLVANNLTDTANEIVNKVFSKNLIYASLAVEDKAEIIEEAAYECQCLKCGKVISSEKHCKDIKCPACGGDMRRKNRPGKGQPTSKSNEVKVIIKQIESKEWICPYCEKTIGEKELFYDEKNQKWYHRPCQEKGEIILPKDNKKEEKIVELKKSSKETKTEKTPVETQAKEIPKEEVKIEKKSEVAETKTEETKVEETKEVKAEAKPKAEETKVETKAKSEPKKEEIVEEKIKESKPEEKKEEPKVEEKNDEIKAEEKKEEAQPLEVIEPKVIVKVTSEFREVRISTFVDGSPSGKDEIKGYSKRITEYKDGTKDEIEEEVEIKKKYDFAEVEKLVNEAKAELEKKLAEKDTEIKKITQELATLKTAKAKAEEKPEGEQTELTVGDVEVEQESELKKQANKINEIIAAKRKQ